jgi:predicted transcriptional regulator
MAARVAVSGLPLSAGVCGVKRSALRRKAKTVSAASEDAKSDRLTLRLASRELDRLRELAKQRHTDVATLAREAISAYLDGASPRVELDRLERALRDAMRSEVDRVIGRHDETTRSLIGALNEHLSGEPGRKR